MVQNTGIVVPTTAIRAGENIVLPFIAEGAITPGNLVKKGTADNQVVVAVTTDKDILGVADLNYNALDTGGVETAAYSAGQRVDVVCGGFVKCLADTGAVTCGKRIKVGPTTGTKVQDVAYTAPPAADTYNTATMTAALLDRDQCIGRAFTSAASGAYCVVLLWAGS